MTSVVPVERALRVEQRGLLVILENNDAPRNPMTFEFMGELETAIVGLQYDDVRRCGGTADQREGVRVIFEKRLPNFRGR